MNLSSNNIQPLFIIWMTWFKLSQTKNNKDNPLLEILTADIHSIVEKRKNILTNRITQFPLRRYEFASLVIKKYSEIWLYKKCK